MTASQLAPVLDALYTVVSAYASVTADGIAVYDGPTVTQAADLERIVIGAGADGDDPSAGTSRQEWRTDGGVSASRDEFLTIPVTVMVRSGDTDIRTVRDRCGVVAGYVEAAVRANPSLSLAQVVWVEVTGHNLRQVQDPKGSLVIDELTVSAQALI